MYVAKNRESCIFSRNLARFGQHQNLKEMIFREIGLLRSHQEEQGIISIRFRALFVLIPVLAMSAGFFGKD